MFASPLLQTLDAVIETGSFDLAAARLGVTPSAVSQRMRALSELAGGAIFSHLQPAEPTTLGKRLLRHAREVGALETGLAADLKAAATPSTIQIAINADSLDTWVLPALTALPDLSVHVVIADQDHSAALLRAGDVAAAITTEARPLPGCDAHPLGHLRYSAGCSPEFAARYFPNGPTLEALQKAPMLQFNRDDALQHRWLRLVTGQDLAPSVHRIPATSPLQHALRLGLGWGTNPSVLMEQDFAEGHLMELAPEHKLETPLTWQISRGLAAPLKPLTRAIQGEASKGLSALQGGKALTRSGGRGRAEGSRAEPSPRRRPRNST